MKNEILEKLSKEDKEIASIKSRIYAYVIDNVLCYFLLFILINVYLSNHTQAYEAFKNYDLDSVLGILNIFLLIYLLIRFFYLLIFTYLYGATIGAYFCKVRSIDINNFDTPNIFYSFLKSIVFVLCDIFFYGILFLLIFTNNERRSLADIASNTVVIKVD